MAKALFSLVLLGLAAPLQAQAQTAADFEPMARACEAFVSTGQFPSVAGEAAFFEQKGFKGAGSTATSTGMSNSYTHSGTPMDPVRILVARPAAVGGEDCTILGLDGPAHGDSFLPEVRADAAWTFDGESNDENGKGFMFHRTVADSVIHLAIWGTGAAYPISVASYRIGTPD